MKFPPPSRKWLTTNITALAALGVMWATTGHWDTEETVAAIGIASQASLGYAIPNTPRNLRDQRPTRSGTRDDAR
jgi:hypothetical protein